MCELLSSLCMSDTVLGTDYLLMNKIELLS